MKTWKYLWLLLIVALLVPLNVSAKKKTKKVKSDRELWAGILYQMAAPVLSNMSEGKLQENMLVELSPTWDGRDKRVTYMECFGRLMAGLAPWLSLPDDDTAEGKQRKQLREWALKSYAQSVDPESKDYLLWRKEGQPLVDAAYIAESFLRGYDAFRHLSSLQGIPHTWDESQNYCNNRRRNPLRHCTSHLLHTIHRLCAKLK